MSGGKRPSDHELQHFSRMARESSRFFSDLASTLGVHGTNTADQLPSAALVAGRRPGERLGRLNSCPAKLRSPLLGY